MKEPVYYDSFWCWVIVCMVSMFASFVIMLKAGSCGKCAAVEKVVDERWGNEKQWIARHIDSRNELWDKVALLSRIVDAQKARIDALERAGTVQVLPYMPHNGPDILWRHTNNSPIIHFNEGTPVLTNDYVIDVPAISPSAVWPIALPTP